MKSYGWFQGKAALCGAALVLALAGCKAAKVANPLTQELAGNDPEQQLEFWHTLTTRPVTSNDEAFHGLLLYMQGEDPANDYEGRVDYLRSRNMLPKKFDRPADESVTRGTLAVAIMRALEIKGGVVTRVFGPTPRYATRELMYLNLYPPSSPGQTFSGTEFVGVMGRVEDFQRVDAAEAPAKLLPSEIEAQQKGRPESREIDADDADGDRGEAGEMEEVGDPTRQGDEAPATPADVQPQGMEMQR